MTGVPTKRENTHASQFAPRKYGEAVVLLSNVSGGMLPKSGQHAPSRRPPCASRNWPQLSGNRVRCCFCFRPSSTTIAPCPGSLLRIISVGSVCAHHAALFTLATLRYVSLKPGVSPLAKAATLLTPALKPSIPVIAYLAIGHDGPISVRPANETILASGDLRVAKNSGMVCRINSGQATRHHIAPLGASPLLRPGRRPGQREHGYKCHRATRHHR
jgi:hypothetical protein